VTEEKYSKRNVEEKLEKYTQDEVNPNGSEIQKFLSEG
jgi:hypothetical protein